MLDILKSLFGGKGKAIEEAMQNQAVIIDVRTPGEYKQGHLKNSKNIPLNEISNKREMIRKWNKPVITVCRSGSRSGMAKSILQGAGINVVNGGPWTSMRKYTE